MRLRRSALSFLLLTGLSLGALSPARAADEPTPPSPADAASQPVTPGEPQDETQDHTQDETTGDKPDPGELSVPATTAEARESLEEVEDLFSPMSRTEARESLASGEGKEATLALRDLSLRLSALPRTERTSAYEQFQRPPLDSPEFSRKCLENICVHWASSSRYAGRDATADSFAYGNMASPTPAPNSVLDTMVNVSRAYQAAGYRLPRTDGNLGGSGQTDIYLMDVGSQSKYGYCTVDVNPNTGKYVFEPTVHGRSSDLPAFCVLDNDYSKDEFPTPRSPIENLKVTAAHEYFHAVQFAYDYLEDRWFMEATATWAEDQVYDEINDNVQYLRGSQLRYPGASLDRFGGANGMLQYGDWLYFEYLTERLPTRQGKLPVLVRRMWEYADSVHGPDYYSVPAIAAALRERRMDFNRMFARYAAANRHPTTAYAEGRANHYPPGRARRAVLKPGHRSTSGRYRLDHLAAAAVRMVPKRLPKQRTRLSIKVDMAAKRSGSLARVVVFFKSGRVVTRSVRLDRNGNGRLRAPFSSRRIAAVDLVLVNASHSYTRCWRNTPYACSGTPRNDDRLETFSAKVS